MNDNDEESRRRQIAENVGKVLAFKPKPRSHLADYVDGLGGVWSMQRDEGESEEDFERRKELLGAAYSADDIAVLESLAPNPSRVIRNRVRCRKCDTVIESKHVHDYVKCRCGAVFVDGGHSYQRIGGEPEDWENLSEYRDEPDAST